MVSTVCRKIAIAAPRNLLKPTTPLNGPVVECVAERLVGFEPAKLVRHKAINAARQRHRVVMVTACTRRHGNGRCLRFDRADGCWSDALKLVAVTVHAADLSAGKQAQY